MLALLAIVFTLEGRIAPPARAAVTLQGAVTPFNAIVNQPPNSGNVENPLYRLLNAPVSRDRDRFNGTFKVTYKPLSWLTAEGNVNYEQSGQMYKSFTPRGFLNSRGAKGGGSLFQQSTVERAGNFGGTLRSRPMPGGSQHGLGTKAACGRHDPLVIGGDQHLQRTTLAGISPDVIEHRAAGQIREQLAGETRRRIARRNDHPEPCN